MHLAFDTAELLFLLAHSGGAPAHRRSAMSVSFQFFTFRQWVLAIEIIDSTALVERSEANRAGRISRRSRVNVSARPSRSDAALVRCWSMAIRMTLLLLHQEAKNFCRA